MTPYMRNSNNKSITPSLPPPSGQAVKPVLCNIPSIAHLSFEGVQLWRCSEVEKREKEKEPFSEEQNERAHTHIHLITPKAEEEEEALPAGGREGGTDKQARSRGEEDQIKFALSSSLFLRRQ